MNSIQDELQRVKKMSKGLPPQAIYIAGICSVRSSLTTVEIFNFLKLLYEKIENNEINKEIQEVIEEKCFQGKLDESISILNNCLKPDWPAPVKKTPNMTKRSVQEEAEAQFKKVESQALELIDMMKGLDSIADTDLVKADSLLVCSLCTNDMSYSECSVLESCPHMFHKICISDYLHSQIICGASEVKCPNLDCKKEIHDNYMVLVLSPEDISAFHENGLKNFIANNLDGELMACPDCKEKFEKPKREENFNCPYCRVFICGVCKRNNDFCMCIKTDPGSKPVINTPPASNRINCKKCNHNLSLMKNHAYTTCKCGIKYCFSCQKEEKLCKCYVVKGRRPGAVV